MKYIPFEVVCDIVKALERLGILEIATMQSLRIVEIAYNRYYVFCSSPIYEAIGIWIHSGKHLSIERSEYEGKNSF